MSKSFNKVILIGNLTRDVEVKYLQSGMATADIGLAVNDRRKQGDQLVDDVSFVDVTLWARNAEVASEYLSKGSPVFIEGRLKLDQWESQGQRRSKLKVVCESLHLIGGRPQGEARPQAAKPNSQSEPMPRNDNPRQAYAEDDTPF